MLTPRNDIPAPSATQVHNFWARVDKSGSCWVWTGAHKVGGYGRLRIGATRVLAHRLSWFMHHGTQPGETLDHLCRNRACVNPAHLEEVSHHENMLRGTAPAANNARMTHCVNGHPLVDGNLYRASTRPGARYCKICCKARARTRERRVKACVKWFAEQLSGVSK